MIRATMTSIAAAAMVFGAVACDPRAFSDLEGDTWVVTSGQPKGMDSTDYVFALAASAGGSSAGGRLIVMGNGPASIGTIDYAANGSTDAGGKRVTDLVTINESTTFDGRRPIAGSSTLLGTEGMIALGLPEESNGSGSVVIVNLATLETQRLMGTIPGLSDQGGSLAFGFTDFEDVGGPDLLASATNNVVLYADALTSPAIPGVACPVEREVAYTVRTADVIGGDTGDEVLIMRGDTMLDGTAAASDIVITTGGNIAAAAADGTSNLCFAAPRAPLATIAAPGGEPDFGMGMVVADFNGNGTADIAASAPSSSTVYVFLDVDVGAVGAPSATIGPPSGSAGFGLAMAAGDLDGAAGDELAIGAPETTIDGTNNAGSVFVYQLSGTNFTQVNQLHDVEPETGQQFGRDVAIAPFGTSGGILGVATAGELFTYFRTAAGFPDVRQ